MIRYAAFLRAINVGGRNLVKMDALRSLFASCGLQDVQSYIQSGNVVFSVSEKNEQLIARKLDTALQKLLSKDVRVFLRTVAALERMIEQDPFRNMRHSEEQKNYVTFFSEELKKTPALPLQSVHKDLEVFRIEHRDAFTVSLPFKGRSGYPNNFIEKTLKVKATTRNWETINKMLTR